MGIFYKTIPIVGIQKRVCNYQQSHFTPNHSHKYVYCLYRILLLFLF